jgi:hypothetical protein
MTSDEELDTTTIIAPAKFAHVEGYLVDAMHQEDFSKIAI